MKIAFDTNILLDLLDERRAGYNAAALLLQICSENNIEIVAFADSILTIKYIMRKENNIEIIEALELLFEILNVIDTKADAVLNALRICKKYNFEDVEDITKLFNAKSENCELFITNDKDLINLNIEEIDIAIVGVDEILDEFGYKKKNVEVKLNEEIMRKKLIELGASEDELRVGMIIYKYGNKILKRDVDVYVKNVLAAAKKLLEGDEIEE